MLSLKRWGQSIGICVLECDLGSLVKAFIDAWVSFSSFFDYDSPNAVSFLLKWLENHFLTCWSYRKTVSWFVKFRHICLLKGALSDKMAGAFDRRTTINISRLRKGFLNRLKSIILINILSRHVVGAWDIFSIRYEVTRLVVAAGGFQDLIRIWVLNTIWVTDLHLWVLRNHLELLWLLRAHVWKNVIWYYIEELNRLPIFRACFEVARVWRQRPVHLQNSGPWLGVIDVLVGSNHRILSDPTPMVIIISIVQLERRLFLKGKFLVWHYRWPLELNVLVMALFGVGKKAFSLNVWISWFQNGILLCQWCE